MKTCPTCNRTGTFRPWRGTLTSFGVEHPATGRRCKACGEIVFTGEQVDRAQRALAAGLVQRGIRAGNEFKLVRKIAGYQAAVIAAMLDVRPETISRWECGEIELPRLAAYVLGELFAHPRITRQKLEALARSE